MEQTLDTIAAMRHQENRGYCTSDWLERHDVGTPAVTSNRPLHEDPVDTECRDKMVNWFNQLVKACHFRSETVEITMSFLDRFLASSEAEQLRQDRQLYQLASMTALYTAVKIHETSAMDPKLISHLSQGAFKPQEIEWMEAKMLDALSWRVNPPTVMAFVRMTLEVLPKELVDDRLGEVCMNLTQMQSEAAAGKHELLGVSASTIAYSALMNALECMALEDDLLEQLSMYLQQALQLDYKSVVVSERVQNILYESVAQQTAINGGFPCVRPKCSEAARSPKSPDSSVFVSPRSIVS